MTLTDDHPTGGAELRRVVLGERHRISRLSRVRELVLGFQDGLLVPLAVVTGLAGANVAKTAVLVGGVAEAAAGALAMGTGAFLASRAENQLYNREIADEEAEIARRPSVEVDELAMLLEDEGLPASRAREVAHGIATSPLAFARTKVERSSASHTAATTPRPATRSSSGWPTRPPPSSRSASSRHALRGPAVSAAASKCFSLEERRRRSTMSSAGSVMSWRDDTASAEGG